MADMLADSLSPYASRYARVAPGGMRRTNLNPAQQPVTSAMPLAPSTAVNLASPNMPATGPAPYDPNSLDSNISQFQGAEAAGVQGYGDMVGQDFRKQVGGLLGDLNSIGGLRSGGVVSGINDLTTNYARQIGDYAKMTAGQATQLGQEEYDANVERKYRADAEKRARRHSLLSGIGTVLGGVGGFLAGGPAGAMAGASVGSKL